MKKTVIVGASPNKARYAFTAAEMLDERGIEFVPIGIKNGEVLGREILDLKKEPTIENVHTVTLYLAPQNQPRWYTYILSLQPERIIFNPGTENAEFIRLIESQNIKAEIACNLVLLSTNQF